MAKSKTTEKISLKNVRLSFPDLARPRAFQAGQDAYFKASFLLDPSNKDHEAQIEMLKGHIKALMADAFNGQKLPPDRVCVQDGNNKTYDGYANMIVVSASNKTRPVVVNRQKELVVEGDPQWPYAGCYVNASITLWAQNNQFGKRINANLRAVQFVQDGEAFGVAPVDPETEFEPLGEDEVGAPAAAGWDL